MTTGTMARVRNMAAGVGLALALIGVGAMPSLVDHAEAGKKRAKAPNVAVQAIGLEPHADAGHKTVVVTVANIGTRKANGFRIGMSAQRADGTVRNTEFSLPLSLGTGETTEIGFRLGCGWIDGGAVTASTDPSPVPGEVKVSNNTLTEAFGDECV